MGAKTGDKTGVKICVITGDKTRDKIGVIISVKISTNIDVKLMSQLV